MNFLRTIKKLIRKNDISLLRVSVILVFLYLAGLAIWLDFAYSTGSQWVLVNKQFGKLVASGLINVAPELAGIAIGVLTIDYLNERRQDKQLLDQLILQMCSKHNDVTETAIAVLRAKNWLSDGSLTNVHLAGSNLSGASLSNAVLIKANLIEAVLDEADLSGAKLNRAKLNGAKLLGTNLSKADLEGANLNEATYNNKTQWPENFDYVGAGVHNDDGVSIGTA